MNDAFPVETLSAAEFPSLLREIPQPPATLNYRGLLPPSDLPLVTVIGTRNYTTYGAQVVDHLLSGLRGYRVGIVSGLAIGIDSLAHKAALEHQLYTLAIPGSGLHDTVLYPARHKALARKILDSGGGLLSEFEPTFRATRWSFIQRNRLMAGIAATTLVIEATEKSGTLATARMCVDYNRELAVVPGSIFSDTAAGPHLFLKLGATPITSPEDLVDVLGLEKLPFPTTSTSKVALSVDETLLLQLLASPLPTDELIRRSGLPATEANSLLMHLELKGVVKCTEGQYRAII